MHDLIKAHHMPVLVAEFGVPASRGLTHRNAFGMNQGFHSEKEQGQIDARLFHSIVDEGYAGGLVFTWQDEWFKRTWNTMDFDNSDRRPYWSNMQTNEQHFGVLGFEPGKKDTSILVDGQAGDWEKAGTKPAYVSKDQQDRLRRVSISSDPAYLYFLLTFNKPVNLQKQDMYLLLDTKADQGQTSIPIGNREKLKTDYGIDFLIKISRTESSRVLVDSYYDSFYYQYGQILKMIPQKSYANKKNNGVFHPIRLALNKELKIPQTGKVIPFQDYETGLLKFGDANPFHKGFDSLTDISISKDHKTIEGRIPWQLLNVKDPSLKEVMGDLWRSGLTGSEKTEGIRLAAVETENGQVQGSFPQIVNNQINQKDAYIYKWKEWDEPAFYERLKVSYQIMRNLYHTVEIGE
ncbi:hypothetical protein RCG23_07360 [Neobacillus sp. PS3-34]|uniref:hypothetical protein n=1 Tax=Neobacillus sp. PS3-34 TaxID=3070678 RepID=UPI0027E17166|nr:hypothetical protein [Neobacillus sp. PS3-34]WML49751.1 hypothetical protein RCG23_07360 [Neobacillus sp. PS3-34]